MLVKTLALEIPCEWWLSILGQESPSFPVQKLAKQRRCSTEHQHVGTSWSLQRRRSTGFLVTGHAGQEPIEDGGTDSILIRIYKAYFLGLCKGISPQNMARNMVLTYLHFRILEFPLIIRIEPTNTWIWMGPSVNFTQLLTIIWAFPFNPL